MKGFEHTIVNRSRRGIAASMHRAFVAAMAIALLGMLPARAQSPVCSPPRCVAQRLTYEGVVYPFNVLLPSGYDDRANAKRYPVVYLIHNAFGNQDTWLDKSDVEAFTASLPPDRQAIVVMPFSRPFGATVDMGRFHTERFLTDVLVPYIDGTFRTIPLRSQRAIAGASYGAFGAIHLAARHPDLFVAAGGFSGAPYSFETAGLPVDAAVPWFPVQILFITNCTAGDPTGQFCNGVRNTGGPFAPFGDPATNEIAWRNHSPADLAVNLRSTLTYIASGNGIPCDRTDVSILARGLARGYALLLIEPYPVYYTTLRLDRALRRVGAPHVTDLYGCGIHDALTWRYWKRDLRVFWGHLNGPGGFGTPNPKSFDYRAADATFSVWGWTFNADPKRASEFLVLTSASCDGLELRGSGATRVQTGPCFEPGQGVALSGALETKVTAGADGRIAFDIDLGPPHKFKQYTPPARALELAGGYFVTRRITFDPRGGV